jgi:hypothetical protein
MVFHPDIHNTQFQKINYLTSLNKHRKDQNYYQHQQLIKNHYHGKLKMVILEKLVKEEHLQMKFNKYLNKYHHVSSIILKLNKKFHLEDISKTIIN